MKYKVLSIAGSDGSGGAGLQADLKTFSALGCYGMTAMTALTIQNTCGVSGVYEMSDKCVSEQILAIFDDIKVDAVKIGMLYNASIIEVVAELLHKVKAKNIVLDTVMVAKSGHKLLKDDAVHAMKKLLFPIAAVVTPNLPEAEVLLGREIGAHDIHGQYRVTSAQMVEMALELLEFGPKAVLLKGGHAESSKSKDVLVWEKGHEWFEAPRVYTKNTHGTGCTLSAAIAALLARGHDMLESVGMAKKYLTNALKAGAEYKIGQGKGPVDHFYNLSFDPEKSIG